MKPLFTLRVAESPAVEVNESFTSSLRVYDYFRDLIGKADREMFYVVHLNTKNFPVKVELHSIGDVDSSSIYPRQVMRSALLFNSSALIFVHNHPTGDPDPSLCDKEITRDLLKAAATLQIKVLDHVIVGSDMKYYSFADTGLIDEFSRGD
jgi:DNA repair protein RadC